jgi:hypothetical protein
MLRQSCPGWPTRVSSCRPAATVARIEAADLADLERWSERVLDAQTLAEVLGDPS